jgi:hypothetical protein
VASRVQKVLGLCWLGAMFASGLGGLGCGGGPSRFPLREPIWSDPDRHPFPTMPEEYFSPFGWDAADQTLFRPVSRFFAVDPAGEALNVNALDEVPDSSWFTNRAGRYAMSPRQMAVGPCTSPPPNPAGPWKVKDAKPNGANPGFIIKANDGKKYLLKFDGVLQGPRATAADAVGSRLYHAAGYFVPCNVIVHFDRKILTIDPEAESEDEHGNKVPLTTSHLDEVFSKGMRARDGRYRASASLYLEGKPLGPWQYQGVRGDDPNDIVPHEDRRELRAMRLLAAWTNHFDSREQNTLAMWIPVKGKGGYVRHSVIDFGDCFGSIWEPPMLGRRIGHAYYLDIPYVLEDTATFGLVRRPWDKARFGPSGPVFGYYDVNDFDPDLWRPGYPNPAFGRMSERDAAWMARIVATFSEAHVRAIVESAQFGDDFLTNELTRILMGRRERILRRYLARLSSLTEPVVSAALLPQLCLRDLSVAAGLARPAARHYSAGVWRDDEFVGFARAKGSPGQACVHLPTPGIPSADPAYLIAVAAPYLIVDVVAQTRGRAPEKPARVHLYREGANYRVVGLERPDSFDTPD